MTLFNISSIPKHPAKYTDILLPVFAEMLINCNNVLDPFAGTGKIFNLKKYFLPNLSIYGVEIEPEWARIKGCVIGNALELPFDDGSFDSVCTSPSYGNRMADKLGTGKWSRTHNTYAVYLGHELSKNNSARLQWGQTYKEFHIRAWLEVWRVVRPNGIFILNIKDHIRNHKVQKVTDWHIACIQGLGFKIERHIAVPVMGNRRGENNNLRIDYESVILFRRKNE